MAHDLIGGVNRDAVLMIEAVQQLFGCKCGVKQLMCFDSVKQQLRFHPVVIFRHSFFTSGIIT